MLVDKLNECRKDQSLIEIGRRHITEETIICQVRAISEDFVQVTEYNQSGEYDGITILYIDHISDILWESTELSSISQLSENITPFEIPQINLGSLYTVIEDIRNKFGSIEVWKETIGTGGQFGEIIMTDEEWIHMHEFSPKSNMNRYHSLLRFDQISKVATDTIYLKDLKKLYKLT